EVVSVRELLAEVALPVDGAIRVAEGRIRERGQGRERDDEPVLERIELPEVGEFVRSGGGVAPRAGSGLGELHQVGAVRGALQLAVCGRLGAAPDEGDGTDQGDESEALHVP